MSNRIVKWSRALCLCCVALAAALLCALPAKAASYTDIQGHWNQKVIEKWSDSGILSGYADGTFRPNAPVTRAQLATVLYRIWGCEPLEDGFDYPDLPKDAWCYDALNTMNLYGVALDHDGKISPDEPLTREEAFFMIGQAFWVDSRKTYDKPFRDVPDAAQVSPQYAELISGMMEKHYVNGSADGRLNPKRSITRAEVMKIIDNLVDVLIDEPGTYTVPYGQNTLVLCGDVTLELVEYKGGGVQTNRTYLMCEASKGGVDFRSLPTNTQTPQTTLIATSQGPAVYTAESPDFVDRRTDKRIHDLSKATLPDTRFSGGRGWKDFPYLISTPAQLKLLSEYDDTKTNTRYFKLACDLDMGTLSAPIRPKNKDNLTIKARLDGDGHTITYQMTDVTPDNYLGGLFTIWKGYCKDLTVAGTVDVTFNDRTPVHDTQKALWFGGFAGVLDGTMENCVSRMDITARYTGSKAIHLDVGGLAGIATYATFTNCRSEGSVQVISSSIEPDVSAGGLLGSGSVLTTLEQGADFVGCGASGTVFVQGGRHTFAGGLIGLMTTTKEVYAPSDFPSSEWNICSMENCWSTADVSASGADFQSDCGGLVGQLNVGTVRSSWAKPARVSADLLGYQNAGAISGACYVAGSISDCWADASSVAAGGDRHSGGITGRLVGSVTNCYTLGTDGLGDGNAVTFQPWNEGTFNACMDMTNASQSQREQFLASCGWDFTEVWDNSGTYPILRGCDAAAQRAAQQ